MRKTSPIVWILVAVLGLFVLLGIAVVGGGFLLAHKAKQAGLDMELMRNNPGLATAKLLAVTNPDLEVVSSDDHGLVTIRQKSTGKIMTVNFDDMKGGKFTFHEDAKSGSESFTMGANHPVALPSWIPPYPKSTPASNFSMSGKDGTSAGFQFQTQDAPKDVVAFYERQLKQNGFHISTTATSRSETSSGAVVSAEDNANKRTVLVTVGTDTKGTSVNITYSQK